MKTLTMALLLCLTTWTAGARELELKLVLDRQNATPGEVVVSGQMERPGWLGISFYPYGTQNVLTDGEHQVMQVPAGRFEFRFEVGSRFAGGGVECALWGVKVEADNCAGPCEWCLSNGYHLENRIAYLYGSLAQAEEGVRP